MLFSPPLRAVALLPIIGLAACATVSTDRGRAEVGDLLASRSVAVHVLPTTGDRIDATDRPALPDAPLDADAAVALAWRNSPRIREHLAAIGLAAADLFDARRPRNPRLSGSRMNGGDGKTSFGIAVVVSDLLSLGARRRGGEQRWQAALAEVSQALVDEASETRRAYYRYLGAQQIAAMRDAVAEAAATSEALAVRFHAAGNLSALQLAREQAAATVARTDAARALSERLAARMILAERLGLVGISNRWQVPERLPLPPPADPELDALLALAQTQRLDLAAARARVQASEQDRTLARRFAWLGEIEFGFEREHENGRRESGPSLSLELPLFRQGQSDRLRARALAEQAQAQLAGRQLAIEREVRTVDHRLATQREIIASYRDALLPQREAVVAREQERYNFMLIGAFELIQARQQEYDAYQGYLEAIRDYWLAHTDLAHAVGGRLPGSDATGEALGADDLLRPPAAKTNPHQHHDHGDQP